MQKTLQKYFGYNQFRPGQEEIINAILNKRDTLCILPTGGGKSICYQVPGLLFPGVTIVISPLISLMKDQVDALNSKGISACYLSSLLGNQKLQSTYKLIQLKKFKFIYVAPERLASNQFVKILTKQNISLIVIDEAHCISQWGDNFRPSYKQIIQNISVLNINCPVAAFTATANSLVQKDICNSLKLKNPFIYYKSFKRTNLAIEVIHCYNQTIKNLVLVRLLNKHANQTGIIYCATRKTTQELTAFLKGLNFKCNYYHAGLEKSEKNNVQLSFSLGHTKIIVATNAFGMGIDISKIRFIIHYQIPGNIENYYQEIGRAGRDLKQSWCYTLVCKEDEIIQYQIIKKDPKKIVDFEKMKKLVNDNKCRTKQILHYFGEYSDICQSCDICNKISYKSQLMIHISKNEINKIHNLIEIRKKFQKINRQFPITDNILAHIALINPQTKGDLLNIPGIGTGFIQIWFNDQALEIDTAGHQQNHDSYNTRAFQSQK